MLNQILTRLSGRGQILAKPCLAPAVIIAVAILLVGILVTLKRFDETPDFGELPDLSNISNIDEMKATFFAYLRPMVEHHNALIAKERSELLAVQERYQNGQSLSNQDREYISQLAEKYDYELVEGWDKPTHEGTDPDPLSRVLRRLLLRVDEIPVSLALVQAAKESGWGRSRFALEANNLFGQWCYTEGCGLVPERRAEGAAHEVTRFDTVADAMASYMNNLNSHESYQTFRLIRSGLRSADEPVTGEALADGLIYYSQRREAYVEDIKAMLREYHRFQEEQGGSDNSPGEEQ